MMYQLKKQHFYFTRHGQTEWNKRRLCQGQKDIPLNCEGIKQAKAIASLCTKLTIDSIITSPLIRAIKTAEEIQLKVPGIKIFTQQNLAERCWGDLEGISSDQMYEIEKKEEQDSFFDSEYNIESRSAFRERVFGAIVQAQDTSFHPLIISHGRVFMELCCILGIKADRQIANCRIYRFFFHNVWKCEEILDDTL